MADANETKKEKSASASLIPLMLAMVVTVLGAVGGALFWLTKSGRLPVAGAAQVAPAPAKVEAPKTRLIALEPMLVNLADSGGGSYLRVVVVLRVDEAVPVKGEKPKEEKPAEKGKVVVDEEDVTVRDTALAVLGRETSDLLLAADGKDRLKQQLRDALALHMKALKVEDVLFTEFLVQR
jgi:flagellar FliL protein